MSRSILPRIAVAALLLASAGTAAASCPSSPRPWCRQFAQTGVRIDATTGAFDWRGSRGPSTTLADFGSPQTTSNYSVCAWDGDALVVAADIPAAATCSGASCWSAMGASGLRYRDAAAGSGALASADLKGSTKGKTKLKIRGAVAAGAALPLTGRLTVQLLRDDSVICFEGSAPVDALGTNEATSVRAKVTHDPAAPVPALKAPACGGASSPYAAGVSNLDSLQHDGLTRTFRVYVPSSYDDASPLPVVFLLHGGFGSGAQIEGSARMLAVAESEGFVVVSPDGTAGPGGVRTWNGGGCCGASADNDVDDVGFVSAMLDRLEDSLCIDRRRVFATGMSNGAILSHRLACDLGDRIAAVAPVSGTDMSYGCDPVRPVPVHEVHGSLDSNVPFDGGFGCGPAGANYRSVPATIAGWKERNGCADTVTATTTIGNASCSLYGSCSVGGAVELCVIDGGGHQWPGGEPPAVTGLPGCSFGEQSQSYSASQEAWNFFRARVPF